MHIEIQVQERCVVVTRHPSYPAFVRIADETMDYILHAKSAGVIVPFTPEVADLSALEAEMLECAEGRAATPLIVVSSSDPRSKAYFLLLNP